jgi:hypothetical protein
MTRAITASKLLLVADRTMADPKELRAQAGALRVRRYRLVRLQPAARPLVPQTRSVELGRACS